MNKKGSAIDILVLIVVALIVVIFFAGWMYGFNLLTNDLITIQSQPNELANVSQAATDVFVPVNTGLNFLRVISFIIIFGLSLSILISNFLVRANPVFFVVYFFIAIIAIVFGVYVSNAYETLQSNSVLGATLATFTGTNFFLANLPIIVGVIALFGAIFLFINVPRDPEIGGGIF